MSAVIKSIPYRVVDIQTGWESKVDLRVLSALNIANVGGIAHQLRFFLIYGQTRFLIVLFDTVVVTSLQNEFEI